MVCPGKRGKDAVLSANACVLPVAARSTIQQRPLRRAGCLGQGLNTTQQREPREGRVPRSGSETPPVRETSGRRQVAQVRVWWAPSEQPYSVTWELYAGASPGGQRPSCPPPVPRCSRCPVGQPSAGTQAGDQVLRAMSSAWDLSLNLPVVVGVVSRLSAPSVSRTPRRGLACLAN